MAVEYTDCAETAGIQKPGPRGEARQEGNMNTIEHKIQAARQNPALSITHSVIDESVQAELRISEKSEIRLVVDALHCPKDLGAGREIHPLWAEFCRAESEISAAALVYASRAALTEKIPSTTVAGAALRADATAGFALATGQALVAALPGKREIARRRAVIATGQARQTAILAEMRRHNAGVLAGFRATKQAERSTDAAALAEGRFWDASKDALKRFFHPPFAKNYLADVSERWRAALYLECVSVSYRRGNGGWGHKLAGTGHAYLCGVDDNGEEWGHQCRVALVRDEYGDATLDSSVENALAPLFGFRGTASSLQACTRQGDLLFSPEQIPAETVLKAQLEPWEVRESHTIAAPGLERNGRYFRSSAPIAVTHTSHAAVTLPPGSYRLYLLQIADAD